MQANTVVVEDILEGPYEFSDLNGEGFFWYEDPYRDGGISQHSHQKLRQQLDTPILQTEHVRGLKLATGFVANESTEFMRAGLEYDAGITRR